MSYTTAHLLPTLRVLPALTSTTLLMYAFDEHLFLSTFMHAPIRQQTNAFLPPYFRHWLSRGKYVIMLGYPLTLLASGANLYLAPSVPAAAKLYTAGMLFNLAHILVFGKTALGLLNDICEDVPKGNVTQSMGTWLRMNALRAAVTDFPAWVCFVGALVVGGL